MLRAVYSGLKTEGNAPPSLKRKAPQARRRPTSWCKKGKTGIEGLWEFFHSKKVRLDLVIQNEKLWELSFPSAQGWRKRPSSALERRQVSSLPGDLPQQERKSGGRTA